MKLRVDKFIWCVRLAKTRSASADLITKHKIRINKQDVKPAKEISIGDTIDVYKNSAVFSYTVCKLIDKRLSATLVCEYITDITSEEEIKKYKSYIEAQKHYKDSDGKPTKKDRRSLDEFIDHWGE